MNVDPVTGEVTKAVYRDGTLSYDTNKVSDETGLKCEDKSLAQQHQKDEADINYMIERFGLAQVVERGSIPVPVAVDYTALHGVELADMLMVIKDAGQAFMKLPAKVRGQFENDPVQFVDFVSNPANIDECVRMGLAVKKESSSVKSDAGSGGTAGSAEGASAGGVGSNGGATGSGS